VESLINRLLSTLSLAGLCLLLAGAAFASQDITPDAITMATTRNFWSGDVAWLTDGRTPDEDPQAPAFEWDWIGLLAVSWPDTVHLAVIRVYLGEMSSYRLFGYAGGGFTQEGQRVGAETAVYGWEEVVPSGTTGWYDIPCAPEFPIDNISFQVIGGAVIYEMRFLAPDGTAIQPKMMTRGLLSLRDKISFLIRLVTGLFN
jgi:hypothetical protein